MLNRTFDCSQAQTGFACGQGKSPALGTVADGEEMLGAAACNHPNWLVLAFRLELIRLAALATREVKLGLQLRMVVRCGATGGDGRYVYPAGAI